MGAEEIEAPLFMTRPLKTTLFAAALALLALVATVSPAAAKSKPACWKLVINDWFDGTIDGKYDVRCYREALGHLNTDLEGYTSARDDIRRALNKRIAEIAAAKKAKSKKAAPTTRTTTDPDIGSNSSGPTSAPPNTSGPTSPPPAAGRAPAPVRSNGKGKKHGVNATTTKPTGPKLVGGSPAPTKTTETPATSPGRNQGQGPATKLINQLGPPDATSLPIPLLVLAGLAVLLMGTGAATLIAKRAQARRVATVPVRSSD